MSENEEQFISSLNTLEPGGSPEADFISEINNLKPLDRPKRLKKIRQQFRFSDVNILDELPQRQVSFMADAMESPDTKDDDSLRRAVISNYISEELDIDSDWVVNNYDSITEDFFGEPLTEKEQEFILKNKFDIGDLNTIDSDDTLDGSRRSLPDNTQRALRESFNQSFLTALKVPVDIADQSYQKFFTDINELTKERDQLQESFKNMELKSLSTEHQIIAWLNENKPRLGAEGKEPVVVQSQDGKGELKLVTKTKFPDIVKAVQSAQDGTLGDIPVISEETALPNISEFETVPLDKELEEITAKRFAEVQLKIAEIRDTSLSRASQILTGARQHVKEHFDVDPDFAESLFGQVAYGVGQVGFVMTASRVPGLGVYAMASQVFSEGYEDALRLTNDPQEAFKAGLLNTPSIALEYLGFRAITRAIFKGAPKAGLTIPQIVARSTKDTLKAATKEGATEMAQAGWQNFVASNVMEFDTSRPITENMLESGVVGFLTGQTVTTAGATIRTASNIRRIKKIKLSGRADGLVTDKELKDFTETFDSPELMEDMLSTVENGNLLKEAIEGNKESLVEYNKKLVKEKKATYNHNQEATEGSGAKYKKEGKTLEVTKDNQYFLKTPENVRIPLDVRNKADREIIKRYTDGAEALGVSPVPAIQAEVNDYVNKHGSHGIDIEVKEISPDNRTADFDPKTGTVTLYADSVTIEGVKSILRHEHFVHGMLKSTLGDQQYNNVIKSVETAFPNEISRIRKTYTDVYGTDREAYNSEVIAELAENLQNLTQAQPLLTRLSNGVRRFSRRFTDSDLSRTEILEILSDAYTGVRVNQKLRLETEKNAKIIEQEPLQPDPDQNHDAKVKQANDDFSVDENRQVLVRQAKGKRIDKLPDENVIALAATEGHPRQKKAIEQMEKRGLSLDKRASFSKRFEPQDDIDTEAATLKELEDAVLERNRQFKLEADNIGLMDETRYQKALRKIENKLNRLDNIVSTALDRDVSILDEDNPAFAFTLFNQAAAADIESMRRDIYDHRSKGSLFMRMKAAGITIDDLGRYTHAKTAEERNNKVAKSDPSLPDGGSGMFTANANKILDELGTPEMEAFYSEFKAKVLDRLLEIRLEAGFIDQETFDTVRGTYDFYAPLYVIKDNKSRIPKALKRSVTANIIKATGSLKPRHNPVVSAIADLESLIDKKHRNSALTKLGKFFISTPDPSWEVVDGDGKITIDESGEVQGTEGAEINQVDLGNRQIGAIFGSTKETGLFVDNEYQISYYVDGNRRVIKTTDEALIRGISGIGMEKAIPVLKQLNNWMRFAFVTGSPNFLISNFEGDLQTALINSKAANKEIKARTIIKDIPSAMNAVWGFQRRKGRKTKMAKRLDEMREQGGMMGIFEMKSIEEKKAEMEGRINRVSSERLSFSKMAERTAKINAKAALNSTRNTFTNITDVIEDANTAVENAVRLSFYSQLRDLGVSPERAAVETRNLTVNFNRSGEFGSLMNSIWLFSNASVQGTSVMLRALGRSKTANMLAFGMFGAGMAEEFMLHAFDDQDENYNKIAPYKRRRYWNIPVGDGDTLTFRVPYGYSVFKTLGNQMVRVMLDKSSMGEALGNALIDMGESFNPIGDISNAYMPTAAKPFFQLEINQNFAGSAIRPDTPFFMAIRPDSELYFDHVNKGARAISWFLNENTRSARAAMFDLDGTKKGFPDISPETIEHLMQSFGGAPFKMAMDTYDNAVSILKGEAPDPRKIVFLQRKFSPENKYAEFRVIKDMLDHSEVDLYNDKQAQKFFDYVRTANARGEEILSSERAKSMRKKFIRNQQKLAIELQEKADN